MKTLLGILSLTATILVSKSLAFSTTLQTPLVYDPDLRGYNCGVVNLDNNYTEMTISLCDDKGGLNTPVKCRDFNIVLGPGVKNGFGQLFSCDNCIALCKFTFQGSSDNVKAGILKDTYTSGIRFIPAE